MSSPLLCDRCRGELESDDAISIIEGVCCVCRRKAAAHQINRAATRARGPRSSRPMAVIPPPMPRPSIPRTFKAGSVSVRSTVVSSPLSEEFGPTVRVRRRRRDLVIGVSVGLILTLSTTGYFLLTRYESPNLPIAGTKNVAHYPVRISIRPPNAKVTLDGAEVGPVDESGRLTLALSGNSEEVHWLEVAAGGFHAVRRPLSIYSGVSEFAVELVPKPYDVAIRTIPNKAEIWINDELKGYSPLTLSLLPWERSRLAIKHAGYQEVARELAPPAQGDRLELDLPLTPASAFAQAPASPPAAAPQPASAVPTAANQAAPRGPIVAVSNAAIATPTGQRIVFLLLPPSGAGADHTILLEQIVDQIHNLKDLQQFAVLTCTTDGLDNWPGGSETAAATSDQKIRAYNTVRAIRPSGRGAIGQALAAALEFRPDAIRIFAAGGLDPRELSSFAARVKGTSVSVAIVQTAAGPDDDGLGALVAAHKGTLTVLGLAATPAVALQGTGE